jgi:hypothetical protein
MGPVDLEQRYEGTAMADEDVKKGGGEGDREAARHYQERTEKFVKSGQVDEAARRAGDQDPEEAARAEEEGRKRAKEDDPALHRDYKKPSKSDD